jgi:hypothetical protein
MVLLVRLPSNLTGKIILAFVGLCSLGVRFLAVMGDDRVDLHLHLVLRGQRILIIRRVMLYRRAQSLSINVLCTVSQCSKFSSGCAPSPYADASLMAPRNCTNSSRFTPI